MSILRPLSIQSNPQIDVIYRDERIIAVTKPSGMVVHRGWGQDAVTAHDLVRDQIIGTRIHAVHRLDRGTSGVLIFALDPHTAREIQAQMDSGRVVKRYIALVRGPMREGCLLDHPVPAREGEARVDAVTEFEPIDHSGRWSLVEARPQTGRLHQIRRHLKHLNHPIVGDVRYGKGDINRMFREEYGLCRLALHAYSFSLFHPNEEALELRSPIPKDLSEPLERLGMIELPKRLRFCE